MACQVSTRERLLTMMDDIELIAKELIENMSAPKHQKLSSMDQQYLVELLVDKDKEVKKVLRLAREQAKIEKKMTVLRTKVDSLDQHIKKLQKQLKEAENILATALFQARQKLNSIEVANKHPVSSEELIKYAYRISASNAICAPLSWQQGDLRRPYPTDIEMRLGFLGKSELNGHNLQHQNSTSSDLQRSADIPTTAQNQFAWMPAGELHMSVSGNSGASSVTIDTRAHKEQSQDDVEVMSTDSSSSSSSDSQ